MAGRKLLRVDVGKTRKARFKATKRKVVTLRPAQRKRVRTVKYATRKEVRAIGRKREEEHKELLERLKDA